MFRKARPSCSNRSRTIRSGSTGSVNCWFIACNRVAEGSLSRRQAFLLLPHVRAVLVRASKRSLWVPDRNQRCFLFPSRLLSDFANLSRLPSEVLHGSALGGSCAPDGRRLPSASTRWLVRNGTSRSSSGWLRSDNVVLVH